MTRRLALRGRVGFLGFALLSLAAIDSQAQQMAIRAGHMLDVERGVLLEDVRVTIVDGAIIEVSQDDEWPEGVDVIDLKELTLLPGLLDAHTHLTDQSYMGPAFDHWAYPEAMFGIVGVANAKTTLQAGFTTVRDVSSPYYSAVALRDAIAAGWVVGPRMYVSGSMITMTGGHGHWGNWMAPQHAVTTAAHSIADGVDEVRKVARMQMRHGVGWLKLAATGGFGTANSIPGAASYTIDELAAAVEEANKRGLKVAAHAHGVEGIANAIKAGVDSIEHGSFLDEATAQMMAEQGVFLVMDLLAAHYDLIEKNHDYSDKQLDDSNAAVYEGLERRFALAQDAGVPIAFGTDAGIYPHGRNAEQFVLMVDAGMTPLAAIRSATTTAAALLGAEDSLGQIKAGFAADLVAVRGNPLEDISRLQHIEFVMKGGRIYRMEGAAVEP